MKSYLTYTKLASMFMLALVISAACVKWEEESRPILEAASSVILGVGSVTDSAITVQVSSSKDGYIALHFFGGTGHEVPRSDEEKEAFLTNNIASMGYASVKVTSGETYLVTFSDGIVQNSVYDVVALANNTDGIVSEGRLITVRTSDNYPPVFLGSSPASGIDAVYEQGEMMVLIFDESVIVDRSKEFIFTTLFSGKSEAAGQVLTQGNLVGVVPASDFPEGDYVFLSWPEGAVMDFRGNMAAAMESYLDEENNFYGVYTRMVTPPREAESTGPGGDSIPSGADIVITFNDTVTADKDLEKGMISLGYADIDGAPDHTEYLDPAMLLFEGTTVTVPQSFAADPGWVVTLTVDEEAFDIGYFVPNAGINSSWRIY
jgi:hypothetical protein